MSIVQLRPATMDDAAMLLEWRNDPVTRANSTNMDMVSMSDHLPWLQSSLASPNRKLFIAERGGVPVGTLRADIGNDGVELSWTVAPEARGQGNGQALVAAGVELFAGSRLVVARIKKNNHSSLQIVTNLGFDLVAEDAASGLTVWELAHH